MLCVQNGTLYEEIVKKSKTKKSTNLSYEYIIMSFFYVVMYKKNILFKILSIYLKSLSSFVSFECLCFFQRSSRRKYKEMPYHFEGCKCYIYEISIDYNEKIIAIFSVATTIIFLTLGIENKSLLNFYRDVLCYFFYLRSYIQKIYFITLLNILRKSL